MKERLTKKEIALSTLTFVICYCVLAAAMFLMMYINTSHSGHNFTEFANKHANGIITVCVSTALLSAIMYAYFFLENKDVFSRCSKIIEIYLLLVISVLICDVVAEYLNPTARPLLFLPLMAAMFFRRRDALFINSTYMLLIFIFNRFTNSADVLSADGTVTMIESVSSILTIFCAGIIGIFLLKKSKSRIGCVTMAPILFLPVVGINILLLLPALETITLKSATDIILYSAFDCGLSVLLLMFCVPIYEFCFAELTPFRLRELTSANARLMSRLKKDAPGTYNHSVVVAQLAEACASAIGEDCELARAAAYYHDIGKLKNPEMFTENQSEYDLHKELTPELSVDIIRSHTRDGAKLIKKYHLPDFFADVAIQHHGTLPIKYFYAKALKMSDGELNAANYSYAGPTPTSKIAAIIMIADASEAAARALPERSTEKVAALVNNIVEERMNLDQFADCNLTMRELTIITLTVINGLTGVYHSRVAYPKLVLTKKK